MGAKVQTQLEKDLGSDSNNNENLAGFENTSNICYANSILQALYHCSQFKKEILNYQVNAIHDKTIPKSINDNPLLLLKEIFDIIVHSKKKINVLNTRKLMNYVRNTNDTETGIFGKTKTFITNIFQGIISTSTKCMKCQNITTMDEPFFDLSIEIEDNFSLNQCLKKFYCAEILKGNDQFDCESCKSKQDAEKSVRITQLPQVLIIQLKRFKYDDELKRMIKLNTKIAFSHEIRINYSDNKNQLYELYAIIVHIGPGQFGHYVTIIKNNNKWIQFDDENIKIIEVNYLKNIYGSTKGCTNACAYMLFYRMVETHFDQKMVELN